MRKFKTQREKGSSEDVTGVVEANIQVVNVDTPIKHSNKMNSMDEEESENLTGEDEDETGSLNESPMILKATSNKGRLIST